MSTEPMDNTQEEATLGSVGEVNYSALTLMCTNLSQISCQK